MLYIHYILVCIYVTTCIHVAIDINIFPLPFKNKVHYFPPNFSSPNNKLLHRIIQIYCLLFTAHLDLCPHVLPQRTLWCQDVLSCYLLNSRDLSKTDPSKFDLGFCQCICIFFFQDIKLVKLGIPNSFLIYF